jgi:hypothetical protein
MILLQFTITQGPYILVQYIAVFIRFLLTIFKEGAGNTFLWLTDTHHI